eukprot:TRINITY_DN8148_c0_g1_i4.p3 TRINITY_DN8148_c0_g1~~TRINITY_DN8148_c0_g1_i4.p3  ORF type:complete len:112 (-),score=16.15 TRINITY_DN8148_c0_g1_i4:83-418(-)
MADLGPRSSANILWSFGSLESQHTPFLAAVTAEATGHLKEFQPQSLSNRAWNLAVLLDRDHRPLMEAISEEFLHRELADDSGDKHSYAILWASWASSCSASKSLFNCALHD